MLSQFIPDEEKREALETFHAGVAELPIETLWVMGLAPVKEVRGNNRLLDSGISIAGVIGAIMLMEHIAVFVKSSHIAV